MLHDTRTRDRRSLSGVAAQGAFTIVAVVLSTAGCSEPAESLPQDSTATLSVVNQAASLITVKKLATATDA